VDSVGIVLQAAAGRISKSELVRRVVEMPRLGWRIAEEDYEKALDYLRRL